MGSGQGEPAIRNYGALNGTIGGRIVRRAVEDLFSKKEAERVSALLFFNEGGHESFCKAAGFDCDEVLDMVYEAVQHEDIRREKAARNIVRFLVGH